MTHAPIALPFAASFAPSSASSIAARLALSFGVTAALLLAGCATRGPEPRATGPDASARLAVMPVTELPPTAPASATTPDAVAPSSAPTVDAPSDAPAANVDARSTEATAPVTATAPHARHELPATGIATVYHARFHGRRTSSGTRYDHHGLSAAHRTLPMGSRVRVTSLASGRSVEVTINDRGPFIKGRLIDLSSAAAKRLGMHRPGVMQVRIESPSAGSGAARAAH